MSETMRCSYPMWVSNALLGTCLLPWGHDGEHQSDFSAVSVSAEAGIRRAVQPGADHWGRTTWTEDQRLREENDRLKREVVAACLQRDAALDQCANLMEERISDATSATQRIEALTRRVEELTKLLDGSENDYLRELVDLRARLATAEQTATLAVDGLEAIRMAVAQLKALRAAAPTP